MNWDLVWSITQWGLTLIVVALLFASRQAFAGGQAIAELLLQPAAGPVRDPLPAAD